jgi:uncharacterized protein GlcG (DUF336 family)
MNTEVIGSLSQASGSLYNIEHSNNGLITFPEGFPIRNNEDKFVGASAVKDM